tara:strand:+ start:15865 stop:18960 length:3096 start_codon:yes stop_codon:yes gene_type:complete
MEFQRISDDGLQSLVSRMQTYLQSLNGAAAFMNASDNVTEADFANFVETLEIDTFLPGISGIGLIVPVQARREAQLVDEMRRGGASEFAIHPDTGNTEKFVIKYISPSAPNSKARGLDISFEQGRRAAATKARDTGEPQLTQRILLVQDATKQPGFLLLRPVFGAQGTDRAKALQGWVYAPFIGANLLNNLSPSQGYSYNISVFDGASADPAALIYDSATDASDLGRYQVSHTIEQFGRPWTIVFSSTLAFDALASTPVPLILLIVGSLLTGLLVLVLRSIRARSVALREIASLRERQIDAHEAENRSIVENAVTAMFILNQKNRILFANQAALICFGYSTSEMDWLDFDDVIAIAPETHSDDQYNAIGRTKTGGTLMLDLQRNDWKTYTGETRVTAIVRDLTSQIAAQDEMRKNKAVFDLALQGAQIGVFDLNLTTGKSEVSDTWRKIMGFPDDADLDTQTAFMARIHPEDLPLVRASDEACASGLTPRSITEFRMRFGEDEWRWMRSDAVVIERAKDGTALRMIGTQTDVNDLVHARFALEASENRFRQVIAAAPVGMALTNDQGEFTSVNQALCQLSGFSETELISEGRISDLMPAEDIKKMYQEVMTLVKAKSSDTYQAEYRLTHKLGFERWGLFNVSWTYDKNGRADVFIAQINDITDQKKLEQIKSEFVSTVSHELRTPLTSIKGALGLIDTSDGKPLTPASTRLIEIAKSNADRLSDIVNDILDLEKISSGEVDFHFEDLSLSDIIAGAVQEMSPFATTHDNTLRVDVPDSPLLVHVDQGRTRQVLANLISNACKYSSANTEVTVRAEQLGEVVIVFIQNSGPGVPEAFRPRIFQAFSQADSSDTRAKGGTGLGLNITRQIVKRQGGTIGFESVPDGVTVFWFTCPLAAPGTVQPGKFSTPAARKTQSKIKVLHVEDDLDFAEVIRTGLGRVADVVNVTSLAQARIMIARGELDVVIVDWSLPDGDARCLLDDLSKMQPQAKIIGLSADSDRARDSRVGVNLVKSRTELDTILRSITGETAKAS